MTAELHDRARRLIVEAWIEDPAPHQAAWLQSHLAGCDACARFAAGLEEGVRVLGSTRIQAEAALVDATKRSVRLYAERVREARSRVRLLAVSCALSAVWGAISLPWLWRAFAWFGSLANVPAAAWQAAFILFWLLPGVAAAAVVLAFTRESGSRSEPQFE